MILSTKLSTVNADNFGINFSLIFIYSSLFDDEQRDFAITENTGGNTA